MVFFAVASHSTKSIITTTTYPTNVPFDVEAVYYEGSNTSGKVYMDKTTVSFDQASGYWRAGEDCYWPTAGTLRFLAVSPVCPSVSISLENGVETDWSIVSEEETQTDLCFAEVSENCASHSLTVPIVFSHALSQICFKARCLKQYSSSQTAGNLIQANVFTVVLDSVKIKGIVSQGHFTQSPCKWTTDPSKLAEYSVFSSEDGLSLGCDRYDAPILNTLSTMLLIPQTLLSGACIEEWHHVSVRSSVTDSTTGEIISDNTYIIPKTSSIPFAQFCGKWNMDYKYTFRLAVGLEDSEVTAALTDWTETKEIIIGDE